MIGLYLGVVLVLIFLGWLAADGLCWVMTGKSFTKWVIAEGNKSKLFKLFVLVFILLAAAFLLYHFTG
jgi:hypothetical protein